MISILFACLLVYVLVVIVNLTLLTIIDWDKIHTIKDILTSPYHDHNPDYPSIPSQQEQWLVTAYAPIVNLVGCCILISLIIYVSVVSWTKFVYSNYVVNSKLYTNIVKFLNYKIK